MVYVLTRDLTGDECPWFYTSGIDYLAAGTMLYPSCDQWGVCGDGVPVSFIEGGPYFEVPRDAVRVTAKPLVAYSVN